MPWLAARSLHPRREAIALSRTPWRCARRALAASLAAWFIASLMGAAVHHCPVHDAMPMAAATHARQHAVPAPAPAGRHEHSPDQSHDHHGGCSCLGQCCAASPAVIDASAVVTLEARTTRPARPALPDAADVVIPTARYTLPFANGPPRTLRA